MHVRRRWPFDNRPLDPGEFHQVDVVHLRQQDDIRWFASETGPRDVVLHNVDGNL